MGFMLVISRKKNEKIIIWENIEITILELGRNRVRFGVQAPREVLIHTRLKLSPPIATGDNVTPIRPLGAAESIEPFRNVASARFFTEKESLSIMGTRA